MHAFYCVSFKMAFTFFLFTVSFFLLNQVHVRFRQRFCGWRRAGASSHAQGVTRRQSVDGVLSLRRWRLKSLLTSETRHFQSTVLMLSTFSVLIRLSRTRRHTLHAIRFQAGREVLSAFNRNGLVNNRCILSSFFFLVNNRNSDTARPVLFFVCLVVSGLLT